MHKLWIWSALSALLLGALGTVPAGAQDPATRPESRRRSAAPERRTTPDPNAPAGSGSRSQKTDPATPDPGSRPGAGSDRAQPRGSRTQDDGNSDRESRSSRTDRSGRSSPHGRSRSGEYLRDRTDEGNWSGRRQNGWNGGAYQSGRGHSAQRARFARAYATWRQRHPNATRAEAMRFRRTAARQYGLSYGETTRYFEGDRDGGR